jgi:hypothetical protein
MLDFSEGHVGILGPNKFDRVFVVHAKEFFDGCNQDFDVGEGTASDALASDLAKPPFDQIQPRAGRGREVEVKTRMAT